MADSCCTYMHEMDDVHRWLPSEIIRDIGIADTAERRLLAVVEDLAMCLAGVLGGRAAEEMAAQRPRPPSSCHGPQVRGDGATLRDHHALAGAGRPRGPAAVAAPPYLPLPLPAPWQVMASGPRNTMVLRPAAALQPRLAPAANQPHPLLRGAVAGAAQPATRRSSGTGFFLPRTAAADPRHANYHAAAARPHTNVPPRQCQAQRQRRVNEAAAMARRQQELTQAMAANLAGAPATTCPELALPQEWVWCCHRNGYDEMHLITNYMHTRSEIIFVPGSIHSEMF